MSPAVTSKRLEPQLAAWFATAKAPAVFAIHHDGEWRGPAELVVGERRVVVRVCPSELAVREALAEPRPDGHGLVLLTAADRLGEDVLARLASRRVHRLFAEDALRQLFDVRAVDPAVAKDRWLVDALVDSAPSGGYERTGARELDRDRAWRALLRHRHGIELDRGMDGLLEWAASARRDRLRDADEDERAWALRALGPALPGAAPVLAAVLAGAGDEALALGLVARVLCAAPDDAVRVAARARFEVRLDGWTFDERQASAWATGAEVRLDAVAPDGPARARILAAADRSLGELHAVELAGYSDELTAGLRQRLGALAGALDAVLAGGDDLAAVAEAVARVQRHSGAGEQVGASAAMALRLLRWLQTDRATDPAVDLRTAAARYAADDSYADWARAALRQGSADPRLDEVVRQLLERADAARERQEAAFARSLATWVRHAATDDALLGVEHVLSRVVAPLAQQTPVLVVVLDGMSHRVADELLEDGVRLGWVELRRAEHQARALVVSALPSVTALSRTSLLTGQLQAGVATDERRAFAQQPDLLAASRAAAPPLLFHKGDVADPRGGLTPALQDAVAGRARVVGVVVNAIDDHLARSEQLRTDWPVRNILPLGWLLEAAREAGRVVVLASDHGHVLEHGTVVRSSAGEGGERWRACGEPLVEGEIEVEGTRVLAPGGRCVLACGERIRYTQKKNGYHGGATAQEVLAPLLVLSPTLADELEGWVEAIHDPPAWWVGETEPEVMPPRTAVAPLPPAPPPPPGAQLPLDAVTPPPPPDLVAQLLASDLFRAQQAATGRTPVPQERFATILAVLDAHNGQMMREALARAVELPPMRLTGTLAAMRQVLNVDGFAVLRVNDATGDVLLDRDLLVQQFDLRPS